MRDGLLCCRCTAEDAVERPALHSEILPMLSRLAGRAESAVRLPSGAAVSTHEPPAMLICPITQANTFANFHG